MTEPNGVDADMVTKLAFDALKSRLTGTTSAEVAHQEGIKLGAQMASEAAVESRSAANWDKVLERVEGMVNGFLDRMEATELRKAAAATPAPKVEGTEGEGDQAGAFDPTAVLAAIGKRPPAPEAAELLKGAGVTAENLSEVLGHVRGAGQGWPAFLDQDPEWLDAVRASLAGAGASE